MPRRQLRPARIAGGLGLVALAGAAAATVGVAFASVAVARTVVTPPSRRTDDVRILKVDVRGGRIVLQSTVDSLLPGDYSFWFDGDHGHARVGAILDRVGNRVTRELLRVDFGDLEGARRGRFSGWFWLSPRDLGYPYENVTVSTPLGGAPAWLIEPEGGPGSRWVIQVHGRAVRRSETLRAVAPFRDAGYTSLLVSYRNDGDAPQSADFRYALGDREWLDIEAAITFARERGATEIVLMGWSMGGATVLQALTRSSISDVVRGVVLESPVVDWVATLDFQARLRRVPPLVRAGVIALLKSPWAGFFTGLAEPLDFDRLDFVRRAAELDRPILLLHSDDDGFVPATASRALAAARPDIVTFVPFEVARHTKLWNYDRTRWEDSIRDWLRELPLAEERAKRASRSA
jgi:dipeptidyl aminopeptidase/acylaminoacyl peptidase